MYLLFVEAGLDPPYAYIVEAATVRPARGDTYVLEWLRIQRYHTTNTSRPSQGRHVSSTLEYVGVAKSTKLPHYPNQ